MSASEKMSHPKTMIGLMNDDESRPEKLLVLVIGDRMGGFSGLLEFLKKRGCRCAFAGSRREARTLLQAERFQLVLDASSLQGDEPLNGETAGPNCTIFRWCPVENSTLWVPVFQGGEKCFGRPALRPREFARTLDRLIIDLSSARPRGTEAKAAVTAA